MGPANWPKLSPLDYHVWGNVRCLSRAPYETEDGRWTRGNAASNSRTPGSIDWAVKEFSKRLKSCVVEIFTITAMLCRFIIVAWTTSFYCVMAWTFSSTLKSLGGISVMLITLKHCKLLKCWYTRIGWPNTSVKFRFEIRSYCWENYNKSCRAL